MSETKYEKALKLWGTAKLREEHSYGHTSRRPKTLKIDPDTVRVDLDFSEGYACCGGTDPHCYCSFAESPSCKVRITGRTIDGDSVSAEIGQYSFDFATMMREMSEIDV
ncbi:hypothetical protein ACFU44_00725 [Nocardia rhizosphaerihabitans]|uniref:hypothetical protein n=1 Tax=Nocardia rhizosphaerihabitans TaxID=1691570 RepID=UPI00366F90CC